MPIITFSDGKKHFFDKPMSVIEIAQSINKKLSKACLAGLVNQEIVDATNVITRNSHLEIITLKNNDMSLNIISRSLVYLLGYAIKSLWPETKMVSGFSQEKNFFYDIDLNYFLNKMDLKNLEKHMLKLIKEHYCIIKKTVTWQEAYNIFSSQKEIYKIKILHENFKKTDSINLSYHNNYVDLDLGPQVLNICFCRYFKLEKTSFIPYQNDIKKNLQRIQGITWAIEHSNVKKVKKTQNIKIKKHDHRKIGQQLNLYHMQEEAPGMIFWHNNGWIIFLELETFVRQKLKKYHYEEVKVPFMMDRVLWEKTGHWENYKESIFTTSSENREYCIKPMNCPGHVQIFNQYIKSYRSLPFRIAEFGSCHRNEPSGALHGLIRVRCFTQDDAHIFCTEEQIHDEVHHCIKMTFDMYNTFGFKKIMVKLSTRPKKRIGNDVIWDRAENDLKTVLQKNKIRFEYQEGEGAFYGPKIEFTLYDYLNRPWQCGTIQLDFSLPHRLNATYITKNNTKKVPVMIHRAILGSMERFIGILTEEYAGCFPTWLSPVQIVVMNLTDQQLHYTISLTKKLEKLGFRVKSDLRKEKIGFKIRENTLLRIPYIFICGDKEMEKKTVSVRTRNGENFSNVNIKNIIQKIKKEIINKTIN